jgi:TM2 domain-containing membrane protein YozV
MNTFSADPDFSKQVVDDLYRYRHKYKTIALVLAIFLGIFGAHRFYVNKPLSATLMLLSAGGGLIWWVFDIFYIKHIVTVLRKKDLKVASRPANSAFCHLKKRLK